MIFDGRSVFPEYLTDVNVIMCPSDQSAQHEYDTGRYNFFHEPDEGINPCRFSDTSYIYFGWGIIDTILYVDPSQQNDPNIEVATLPTYVTGEAIDILMNHLLAAYPIADPANPGDLDSDIPSGNVTLYRLREGIERFFITDINNPAASTLAQSEVWVMCDGVTTEVAEFNHVPGGANVLYMDGHVEFLRYPSETPCSRAWAVLAEYAPL